MPRYLSWDCGYRTLGWCDITIELGGLAEAHAIIAAALASGEFTIHNAGVADVLGEKVSAVPVGQRAALLAAFLRTVPIDPTAIVLVEQQPPHLARFGGAASAVPGVVANQLVFYYAAAGHRVEVVSPKLKNTIALCPEAALANNPTAPEHVRKAARKQQSVANFNWILQRWPYANPTWTPATCNHVADACMQAVTFAKI
jgi:hypothetical protein